MKRIYMIVDSMSGLTKKEADDLGYGFMPQIINIDGKDYKDGIDIFMEDAVELIKNAKDCKTSVPPVGEIMDIIEKNASKYDMVVYWPMNKGVTSTYNTVCTIARNFDNVHVVDAKMYSAILEDVIVKVKEMLENNSSIEEAFAYIKKINDKTTQYIIPKDIKNMIKSGRISGAKKIILEKGKLIPKLLFTDDGLKPKAVKRNFAKMIKKTIEQLAEELPKNEEYSWLVMNTGDFESVKIAEDAIKELGFTNDRRWVPPVVTCHIGVGGISISTYPKIK